MVAIDSSPQQSIKQDTVVFDVDAEHIGIRAVGCSSFLVFGFIAFIFLSILFDTSFLPALLAIVISAVSANILERALKGRWKSGRKLTLDNESIILKKKGSVEHSFDVTKPINPLGWHFVVKRTSRVKKGWHVVALALEQNDERIPVYTFASPTDFEAMEHHKMFIQLQKEDKDDKKKQGSIKRAGAQRRLFDAELERGVFGAEMTLDQFKTYLQVLHDKYPDWVTS